VDGLSARTVSEIQRAERSGLGPGTVARALTAWKRAVYRRNIAVMLEEVVRHGCPCCDPTEARETLQQALSLLSPRARRELWSKVEPVDEEFRRRTVHDPNALPGPWWHQRA
jgi:hypothetical protein